MLNIAVLSEDSAKRLKEQKENRIIFAPRLNTQDDRDELELARI